MKLRMASQWLLGLLLVLILGGCATRPRIDWNSRIGIYTFDQTVHEMGPPDKWVKLEDGSLVGEWLVQRGYTRGTVYGMPGWYPQFYSDIPTPDYYLRLTYGPDGQLASWKQVAR